MLSISDWITFLSSEKNSNIGNIIGFSAFILAALAIIMSVTDNTWPSAIVFALIAIVMAAIYFWTIGPYGRRAKVAGKLLDDIMSGKERDLSKIETEWVTVLKRKKQKNNKD